MARVVGSGRWWGRLGSVITVLCVLTHLAMVHTSAAHGSLIPAAFAAGMAALCLPCAGRLWHKPDPHAWRMAALMAAVMLLAHPLLRPEHAHGGTTLGGNAAAATLLLIAVLRRPGTERATAGPPWRLHHDEI
ncbi:hypothetical protein [Paractinoplanes toevensis]|uniref:Uncharacterized protein n=1 Tax=Paractinoplanes toevensis TaxID=571911 RepID=A0A919WAN8_9ACTN|nr:hypothetical protein [Actinoplanes toevensis]GIM96726.1 hypothetical protein Ato02nite_085190 [Actinoplanes toevensis]